MRRLAAWSFWPHAGRIWRWAHMKAIVFSLCAVFFSTHAAASFGAKCELSGVVETVMGHTTKSGKPDNDLSVVLKLTSVAEFVRETRGQGHDAWCNDAFKSELEAGKITISLRSTDSYKPPSIGDAVVFVFTFYSFRGGIHSGWMRSLAEELRDCKTDLGGCS
jgi:hypothetical protein